MIKMINADIAQQFAEDWINAWNSHDLDAILSHYADELTFYSPLIAALQFNEKGIITNKTALKEYFKKGLSAYPDLHFQLHDCLAGVNTFVLYYTSINNKMAAEVFELNDAGKAVKVFCNYAEAKKQ